MTAPSVPGTPGPVVQHHAPSGGGGGPPVLDVRQYCFWYGPKQALFDLALTIPRQAVTALIGPSGCGKSTFLRSINRMNELQSGTRHTGDILLEGVSVFSPGMDTVDLRRQVGMVFQRPNPFPKSIFDNVAYGPRLNRLCREGEMDDPVEDALRRPLGRGEGPAG
jgi:phosphate transport system ATP-binding protein